MKRFVIFLPVFFIGVLQAADIQNCNNSSEAIVAAPATKKSEILVFRPNAFYDKTRSEVIDSFTRYVTKESDTPKMTADDWKQMTENRSTLFPFITLQESTSKSTKALDALKESATVLFDHDGTSPSSFSHDFTGPNGFEKIKSIMVKLNPKAQDVVLNMVVQNGNVKESKEIFIADQSKDHRPVTAVYFDPVCCDVWFGLKQGGVYRYKVATNGYETYADELEKKDIKALGLMGNGKFLITATDEQFLITNIKTKTPCMKIEPKDWTKAYVTNHHVILSKKWYGKSYSIYFTIPVQFGLGIGFTSPNELAYLWWLNQLQKGLSLELANRLCPTPLNTFTPSLDPDSKILKASLLVNSFLRKPENVRPFDKSLGRVFKAFLKENETLLTSKK